MELEYWRLIYWDRTGVQEVVYWRELEYRSLIYWEGTGVLEVDILGQNWTTGG